MRWLLFLIALSASADCTSRTLLRADKAIGTAHIDGGVLYFSFAGEAVIRRLDDATSEATPFFTADANLEQWETEDGAIALLASGRLILVPRDEAPRVIAESPDLSRLQLHGGYLYWMQGGELRRVAVGGGTIETIAIALTINRYVVFGDRLVFSNASGLYWQTFGGAPVLVQPPIGTLNAVTDSAILVSAKTNTDPHVPSVAVLRVPWMGEPVAVVYKAGGPYDGAVSATAFAAGLTVFLLIERNDRFFGPGDELLMVRNGVHLLASSAWLRVFAADDEQITFGHVLNGMYQIDRRCVSVRARVIR